MTEPKSSHLTNPHDRFFRHFLGHPQRARAFIRTYLPPDLVAHLELDTLQVEQTSFVDPDLRSHQGDLLFRVALKTGGDAYLYFLFEHKSYPDPYVVWQMLRYMVRIWERVWRKEKRLVPVVPSVVYHGDRPWTEPKALVELVNAPEAVRAYVPDFQYLFYDLTAIEDDTLRANVMLAAGLLLMKYIRQPALRERLGEIVTLIGEMVAAGSGVEAAVALLRYVAEAGRYVTEDELREAVNALPKGGEVMATIAQRWLEQGLQQGLQQGIQQGMRDGMVKALLALLRVRFGPEEAQLEDIRSRLAQVENIEQLEALHITAAQVDDWAAFEQALNEIVGSAGEH